MTYTVRPNMLSFSTNDSPPPPPPLVTVVDGPGSVVALAAEFCVKTFVMCAEEANDGCAKFPSLTTLLLWWVVIFVAEKTCVALVFGRDGIAAAKSRSI